jgi:hypothetical protein
MDESIGNMSPLELRHLLATFLNDTSMNPKPPPITNKDVDTRAGIKRYKTGVSIRESLVTSTAVQPTDDVILSGNNGSSPTVTMADPLLNQGRTVTVKHMGSVAGAQTVVISQFSAGDTVEGAATFLLRPKQSVELVAQGSNWAIVGGTKPPTNTILSTDVADGEFLELFTHGTRRRIAFGAGTMTFDGTGAFSNQVAGGLAVAHGMGLTPSLVLAQNNGTTGVANFCSGSQIRNIGGTNFTIQVNTTDGSVPANGSTQAFQWAAIG